MTAAVKPTVTRKGSEHTRTAQSGGAVRISGVSPQHTPATKIWFGKVSNEPGFRSLPHHHGEAETGGYVFKGKGRIYWGENCNFVLGSSLNRIESDALGFKAREQFAGHFDSDYL